MSVILILAILMLSFTLIVWSVMSAAVNTAERYTTAVAETTESGLQNLFMFVDSRKVLIGNMLLIFLLPAAVYLLSGSLLYVAISIVAVLAMPRVAFRVLEARRRQAINEALPDSLAQISGAMRAGSTLTMSIQTMVQETKGPIGQEFGLVLREQRMGLGMEESLDNMAERVATEDMDLVVSAALISRDVGGNLAEILMSLSTTLRRKMEMEGKIKALTAQGKLQGWVVGLLPFAVILGLTFVEPDAMQPIFDTLLGWMFLLVIVVLELIGGFFIKKIVTIDI